MDGLNRPKIGRQIVGRWTMWKMEPVGTGAFARPGQGEARPHVAQRFSAGSHKKRIS